MQQNMVNPVTPLAGGYVAVAAGQTGAALGTAGTKGDVVIHVLVKPATTSPGAVTLIDGSTSIVIYPGGTVADVTPVDIPWGTASASGAWTITTGSNVSVVVFGCFTNT